MSGKVIPLQRQSLTEMLKEIETQGPKARGVVMAYVDPDGHAAFRISGFTASGDSFYVCGLLDWIKADLMADFT